MRASNGLRTMTIVGGLLLLGGCSSAPPPKPTDSFSEADYAIAQAARAVGERVQSVPLYEAERKLDRARDLVASQQRTEGDVRRARLLAEKAVVDARLAEVQAERRQAKGQIEDLEAELADLRKQLEQPEGEAQ